MSMNQQCIQKVALDSCVVIDLIENNHGFHKGDTSPCTQLSKRAESSIE